MSALINELDLSWRITRAWAKAQIETLRSDLERPLDHDETTDIRARISQLRTLLRLPKDLENDGTIIDTDQL